MNMKKNLIYTLMFAGAVIMTACSKDELPDNIPDVSSSEIRFTGAIKKQSEILATTRAEPDPNNYVTLNETNENFGTFFIWLTVGEGDQSKNYFQKYVKAEAEAGNLTVEGSDNNEGRLNWVNKTSKHTFYAWTEPHVPDNTSQITGGVQMDHKNIKPSGYPITGETEIDDITGTVIYGTNNETNLEQFIVTKKGPLTYNDWGQDVALYFERPIAKIELVGITHIKEGGEEDVIGGQDNFTCTINFPNMYNKATFTPANFEYSEQQSPLSTNEQDKGLVWNYSYSDKSSGSVLYVHPFKFRDDSNSDNIYDDPGYFIVTATFNGEEMHYVGTLGELSLYTQLDAGEYMKLWLYLRDARGTGGVGYEIKDWGTDPEQTLPQYRIPGVYNKEDAERLLEALQKAANSPGTYTFPEGVEDLVVETSVDGATSKTYEINLFTHIDWSSVTNGDINIPDNCILKGNGYNVSLGTGGNITGKQVENIYVNNRVPGVYSQTDADKLLTALTATEESKKFPNGVKDLLVGSTINLFCNIDWSSYAGTEAITIPDGYSLNGNDHNITLPDGVSITGNNIENLYVNEQPYSNENGESDTDEPSGSDATGDLTT